MSYSMDLILKNGYVIDGSGRAGRKADIGIAEGRIVFIGNLQGSAAARIIDVDGLAIAPGFVDIHNHTDATIQKSPRADSFIYQGVTTVVTGNCGQTAAPLSDDPEKRQIALNQLSLVLGGSSDELPKWNSFKEYLAGLSSQKGLGINLVPLVGHGALRMYAMGMANRAPTEEEMRAMEELLENCLKEGAFGMSTGLAYAPGSYAVGKDLNTAPDELIRLAKVLARYDALYATHMRSETHNLIEAVRESIDISQKSGCRLEISHIKAGIPYQGRTQEVIEILDNARKLGARVTWDIYPYTAWGESLGDYLPKWVEHEGIEQMKAYLADPKARRKIKGQVNAHADRLPGWDNVVITRFKDDSKYMHFEGKSIAHISSELRRANPDFDDLDVIFELLLDNDGAIKILTHGQVNMEDVWTFAHHEQTAFASDGRALRLNEWRYPHPRYFGTFPRYLRAVREGDLKMTLEEAIFRMTKMPAERLGLYDRGIIAVGNIADLVVFNKGTVRDNSTYEKPNQFPTGIEYVIVGGEIVVERGNHTCKMPGQIIQPHWM